MNTKELIAEAQKAANKWLYECKLPDPPPGINAARWQAIVKKVIADSNAVPVVDTGETK